jgi:CHAT domain-containing protein
VVTIAAPEPTRLPPLPGAATEADLAALGQPLVSRLHDATASAERLATALPDCWLLHAACHGVADIGDPLRSGLMLANDRRFTLARLLATKARIRIAVLSACESGRIGTSLPDEAVSLPSGLIQAGTAGVVASAWAVPDGVTLALMAEFYWWWRHGSGESPASALAKAQAWLRDTTNQEKLSVWKDRVRSGALPEGVFDALQDVYLLRAPDDRDDAVMGAWASFTHVGV